MAGEILAAMTAAQQTDVVLIGMPGGGKSAAGRALARRLQCPLVSTDDAVASAAGMPIADIFAARGETYFRRMESETLRTILEAKKDAKGGGRVISAGGGVVLHPKNRILIRGAARAVYLRASVELLARRLKDETAARPLLPDGDLTEFLSELLAAREPLYQQTAHLAVMQHADDSPADVAAKVRAGLRHLAAA